MDRADVIAKNDMSPQLDYRPCRYGGSRVDFRGPRRRLDGPYVAAIGGSETFGKFVERPFAAGLEGQLGEPVVNLGVMHAGLTLIADDPAILPIASAARMAVVQVLGAQNMSNRFYMVHPRRNDRFLSASDRLQSMFPEIDFTEINFTGHLLGTLEKTGKPAYQDVVQELKTAWISRMKAILDSIKGERVLLWMADRRPEDECAVSDPADPIYVDRAMLDALAAHCAGVVEVVAKGGTGGDRLEGKRFDRTEMMAAAAMPGPDAHDQAARALASAISMPEILRRADRADAPQSFDPRLRAFR